MSGRKNSDYQEGYKAGINSNVVDDVITDIGTGVIEGVTFGLLSQSDDYKEGQADGREDRD